MIIPSFFPWLSSLHLLGHPPESPAVKANISIIFSDDKMTDFRLTHFSLTKLSIWDWGFLAYMCSFFAPPNMPFISLVSFCTLSRDCSNHTIADPSLQLISVPQSATLKASELFCKLRLSFSFNQFGGQPHWLWLAQTQNLQILQYFHIIKLLLFLYRFEYHSLECQRL